MKTSCFTGGFHRFDHSSNDGFMNHFLKIAVPKFSKYIIRETMTILAKKKPKKRSVLVSKIETYKGVLVSKILTIYIGHLRETHVETATRKLRNI